MRLEYRQWNLQQKNLKQFLRNPANHELAIDVFLEQHAAVHSRQMSQAESWSFEDEIWRGLSDEAARYIPSGAEHSIAWIEWHIARIEDVTMNLLVAGTPQVLTRDRWLGKMKITRPDTGNSIDCAAIASLGAAIDLEALRSYRVAVGCRTREIVQQLKPTQMKQKVDPCRIQQVIAEGAVMGAAYDLLEYWGNRTIAGLLLMPPTRHNFVHLNEALRIRHKLEA